MLMISPRSSGWCGWRLDHDWYSARRGGHIAAFQKYYPGDIDIGIYPGKLIETRNSRFFNG
jgi:hypothetical protein